MKKILLAALLALVAVPAFAADTGAATAPVAKAKTAQQQKMTSCNAEAKSKALKGAERKTFMSGCLKGGAAAAVTSAKSTQQQKMTSCNAEAKSKALKGVERKTFMSSCLKS